jgi:hypothetical protein
VQNKLEQLFELQDKLNARFGWSQRDLLQLSEQERLQRVRNYLEVLMIESGEVLKAAKSRWWKQDKDWQGWDHLKEEIIDCFHFLASAYLAAGGNAEDFYGIYLRKNQFNHERKDWAINEQKVAEVNSGSSETQEENGERESILT